MRIEMMVNGKSYAQEMSADANLFEFLRACGFNSVKCGCETSNCGLCTVWLDGKPILSCSVLAARIKGAITTLEALQDEAREFGGFLADEGAEQCGFCAPGFTMSVLAMKRELVQPTDDEIRAYLSGNLCRCSGYMGQMRAIKNYMSGGEEA